MCFTKSFKALDKYIHSKTTLFVTSVHLVIHATVCQQCNAENYADTGQELVNIHIKHQIRGGGNVDSVTLWHGCWCQISWFKFQKIFCTEWCIKWETVLWEKCLDERTQRKMANLVPVDRKAAVSQITTIYNLDEKNAHGTHRTLRLATTAEDPSCVGTVLPDLYSWKLY